MTYSPLITTHTNTHTCGYYIICVHCYQLFSKESSLP